MKCQFCGSDEVVLKKDGYYCVKCGKKQEKRKQYTFPLEDSYGKFMKKK
jgi:hypothetical protein